MTHYKDIKIFWCGIPTTAVGIVTIHSWRWRNHSGMLQLKCLDKHACAAMQQSFAADCRASQRAVRWCVIKTELGLTAQLTTVIKTLAQRQIAWGSLSLLHSHTRKLNCSTQGLVRTSRDNVQTVSERTHPQTEKMKLFLVFNKDKKQGKAIHACNY